MKSKSVITNVRVEQVEMDLGNGQIVWSTNVCYERDGKPNSARYPGWYDVEHAIVELSIRN